MHDKVVQYPHVIDIAKQAMIDCDIEPDIKPIRGGTDGAQLSYRGLPLPVNIFLRVGIIFMAKYEFILFRRYGSRSKCYYANC